MNFIIRSQSVGARFLVPNVEEVKVVAANGKFLAFVFTLSSYLLKANCDSNHMIATRLVTKWSTVCLH